MNESGTVTITTEEYLSLVQRATNIGFVMEKYEQIIRDNQYIRNMINEMQADIHNLKNK